MTDRHDDVAPDPVQQDIAAMLRRAAETNDGPRMPADVSSRIRAALDEERRAMSSGYSDPGRQSDAQPTVVPLPRRHSQTARTGETPEASQVRSDFATPPESRWDSGAPTGAAADRSTGRKHDNVASFEAHREKRGNRKIWTALSAAAAVVAVGGVSAKMSGLGSDEPTTSGTSYASKVSVTQSDRAYDSNNLATQAASLTTNNSFPTIKDTPENRQKLGAMVSSERVSTCVNAVNSLKPQEIKHIYADFGTYSGKQAVIVVVEKTSGSRDVWVVSQSCQKAQDKLAGPKPVST